MAIETTKSKCPGQDTSFWKPGDIYDVKCAVCGNEIEFFKDDASRRCRKCGASVKNPKLSLGCAQWCEHAEECLGYDPKKMRDESTGSGETQVDEMITAMKNIFGDDQKRITHALSVLEYAEEIMKEEGGNPKVILAAAILHDIGIQEAENKHGSTAGKYQEMEGPGIAKGIMRNIGLDEETIYDVCDIIGNHHSAKCKITTEFKVIWDADLIVNIPELFEGISVQELGAKIDKLSRTETGNKIAKKLYTEKGEGV